MNKEIIITSPIKENGKLFVEYKRPFLVRGNFNISEPFDENTFLYIFLSDKNNKILRYTKTFYNNQQVDLFNNLLLTYPSEFDPDRTKLKEYGFPILRINDLNNINDSINNATIKSSFNEEKFESLIVSASDTNHGAILDYGIKFVDEFNNPYDLLEKGEYTLTIELSTKNKKYKISEPLVIGSRLNQLICRFNPLSHKERMIKWANINNYSIIIDTVPGYLDSYLGFWLYHMGIIKMYHASDVALYDSAIVRLFIYAIDSTSTSYKLEIPYLEIRGIIENSDLFHAYHYDIGEAVIGLNKNYYKEANILEFKKDEFIYLSRIDIVNDLAKENVFYFDERHIISPIYDMDDIIINKENSFMIMGIIKPYQENKNNYVLNELNNTFDRTLYPKYIKYSFIDNGTIKEIITKELNLYRMSEKIESGSMYEFYNLFNLNSYDNGKYDVLIEIFDNNMNKTKIFTKISLNLK